MQIAIIRSYPFAHCALAHADAPRPIRRPQPQAEPLLVFHFVESLWLRSCEGASLVGKTAATAEPGAVIEGNASVRAWSRSGRAWFLWPSHACIG